MSKGSSSLLQRFRRIIFNLKYGKQTILIYTLGKVGSSSFKENLKEQFPYVTAFHIHFLSDHWLKEILPKENILFHSNIRDAEVVKHYLKKNQNARLKIITLVREPLIRDISDIFQNWEARLHDRSITDLSKEELTGLIDRDNHEYTLNWFDTEFKNYLGFDIYSEPFDREKGYSIYHTPAADILCIQLEQLNERMEEASKLLLGYGVKPSMTANLTENKLGNELYSHLKKHYVASEEKLNLLYNSRYVRHFYNEKTILGFRKKWGVREA